MQTDVVLKSLSPIPHPLIPTPYLPLLVAALVGLAVGTERERSGHATGPDARFAGLRTFGVLGAIGGFAGWFYLDGAALGGVVLFAATLLFPIAAYVTAMRRPGSTADGTTEVAAMFVIALGFTAGLGHVGIASGAAVLVVVLLAEKSVLHRALHDADSLEVRAAVQFAVLALVVLPVLPEGAYGPYGAFQPRTLWIVVLLFSGMNFIGYLARRKIGETRGLVLTGLLGGLVSSTAVALNFSRRSRDNPTLAQPLALGVIAACTMLLPRIIVVCTVLRPAVAIAALPMLTLPFVVGALIIARALWQARHVPSSNVPSSNILPSTVDATTAASLQNPLALASSLQMAAAFQIVLFVIAFMQQRVGNTGVLMSATLLGLTDMDALTFSMARLGNDPQMTLVAAQAIGIGVLSNTALKIGVSIGFGASGYRWRVALGLLALAAASGIGLWFVWP